MYNSISGLIHGVFHRVIRYLAMSSSKSNKQIHSIDVLNEIYHQEYELKDTENGYRMIPRSKRYTFNAESKKKTYSSSANVNLI